MLWEWRGIANLAFIQLGWVSRVDDGVLQGRSMGAKQGAGWFWYWREVWEKAFIVNSCVSCVRGGKQTHLSPPISSKIHLGRRTRSWEVWDCQLGNLTAGKGSGGGGSIMGEPLSPDHVFDFPMDEPVPHPAYDFFAPGPLPGYAGNSNNNNGWIEADVPLLGELGAKADEPMVVPVDDEIAEPIVGMEEQVIALVINMGEDIAMLFGDGNFSDDDSEGFDEEEGCYE
ncbi:hypothetical protein Tco_0762765 [Tanacetum coccineum]